MCLKKRLVILSDLWGVEKSEWINYYFNSLETDFDIIYYDSCKLGAVDKTVVIEEERHSQFIKYGITIAVEKLLKLELEEIVVLAFSVGGTIAWKAALSGLKIRNLYAISATRLRYEVDNPGCNIKLIYGENDSFIPSLEWFGKKELKHNIINNIGHEIYSDKRYLFDICDEVKKNFL